MNKAHEIRKIEVKIAGNPDSDIQDLIKRLVPEIAGKYFDQYMPLNKDVFIDKIELNLGTIKKQNFEDEFAVRLSYLLNSEFKKFFLKIDVLELMDGKFLHSTAEIFTHYLKAGFSKGDKKDLTMLF